MKSLSFKRNLSLVAILLCLTLFGCKESSEPTGVTMAIKEATAPFNDEERVDSTPPIPQKSVLVKVKYQGGLFWTETRKDKIERFKCSRCHNGKEVRIDKAAEITHGDILVAHGEKYKPLSCFTCHNQEERDFLVTEKGIRVDMDHAYQMCGQCHFRQKKDWVGGAHGKRISSWAGKRVVKSCTSCHDPHSPKFAKRWPKTYSLPISE